MPAADRTATRRAEEELLARLGLDRGANPLAVETARDRIVTFLGTAPADLRPWAQRQAAATDEAYALLADPTADLSTVLATSPLTLGAATDPSPVATTPVPTARARRGLLGGLGPVGRAAVGAMGLVLAGVVVYGVYAAGQPTVPGISGSPAPEASAVAQASPAVDQAQVAVLMQKISADPTDVASYASLMDLYFGAEDYTNALTFAQKVVSLDPTTATNYLALGAAYYNTGDEANAETAWNQAITLDPSNAEAYYDLGYLYLTQQKPDDAAAKAAWQKVLDLAPDSQYATMVTQHMGSLFASPSPSAGN